MKETERTKRGEIIFERIREMALSGRSEALKNNKIVPEYIVIGSDEQLDLVDYCIREHHLQPFDGSGVGCLFGLKFISHEDKIVRYNQTHKVG